MKTFLENEKLVRISSSVAAGTEVTTSDIVDTDGFDSITIFTALGSMASSSSAVMTIEQNTANSTTGMSDIGVSVSADAGDDERIIAAEIYRPRERYLQAVVTPGTSGNAEIDGIFAVLRDPQEIPVSQSTTYIADFDFLASPEET